MFEKIERVKKNRLLFKLQKKLLKLKCLNKNLEEVCIISGKHTINQNIVFENPVIIEEGSELVLLENSNLYFKSSVKMNGSKSNPILVSVEESLSWDSFVWTNTFF